MPVTSVCNDRKIAPFEPPPEIELTQGANLRCPPPLALANRGFLTPAPRVVVRFLLPSAFHVDAREPAVAHSVLDQPHKALATRAFEQADIVASVYGFERNRDALHAARET